jgi:hypothetical protein
LAAQHKRPHRFAAAPAGASGLVTQGLVELIKAVKGAGFYPAGHPHRTGTVQRAFEVLRESVSEHELIVTVNRQGFAFDGELLPGPPMVLLLARECSIRRIVSITFMQDLLLGDLEVLVHLLNAEARQSVASGGLARELERRGVKTIWINEKNLGAIRAKRGAPARQGTAETVAAGSGDREHPAGTDREPSVGEDREGSGGEPREAGRPGVSELLRLMARESGDGRYQELGRELLDRLRGNPAETAILPVLEELLRQHREAHRSLPQREYALYTLGHLSDAASETLLGLLESRECREKEGIHRVLAALGGKSANWIIQRICLAEGLYQRKSLAAALISLGPPAIPSLAAMLRDERWYVVRNMVSILGEIRRPECVAALRRPLYHGDARVRKETIRALTKIGGEAAEGGLIQLLEERDQGIVRHAILSLGLIRSSQAVPQFLRLLEKRDPFLKGVGVKKELLVALGRIGDRRVTGVLLKLLKRRGWLAFGRRLELRIAVAATLGALGDQTALPVLKGLAAGSGALAQACREALDAIEGLSGGIDAAAVASPASGEHRQGGGRGSAGVLVRGVDEPDERLFQGGTSDAPQCEGRLRIEQAVVLFQER